MERCTHVHEYGSVCTLSGWPLQSGKYRYSPPVDRPWLYTRAYAVQILLWVSYLKVLLDLEDKYGSALPNVEFVLMTNDRPTRLTNCTRGYNPKGVAASPGDGSSSDSAFVTNPRNPCR